MARWKLVLSVRGSRALFWGDIQEGMDALLGMFNAVISVAEAGAAVGFELAAAQQQ